MNNWNEEEIAFRCNPLSLRIERLTQNFLCLASLSLDETTEESALAVVRESKVFIELTALDLDVDRAFELAQIQRQLSKWHVCWSTVWKNEIDRREISALSQTWVNRLREMSMAFT